MFHRGERMAAPEAAPQSSWSDSGLSDKEELSDGWSALVSLSCHCIHDCAVSKGGTQRHEHLNLVHPFITS